MSLAQSYTVDQLWSDKTAFDRNQWFNRNSERVALARGAVVNALRDYAKVIAETEAHEARAFNQDEYVSDMIDASQATLAPEVREWLEG